MKSNNEMKPEYEIYGFLSKFLIKYLKDEEFTPDVLFLKFLYMFFCILKVRHGFNEKKSNFEYLYNIIKHFEQSPIDSNDNTAFLNMLISNAEVLSEIKQEVLEDILVGDDVKLYEWIDFCNNVLAESPDLDFTTAKIFYILNDHFQNTIPLHLILLRWTFGSLKE